MAKLETFTAKMQRPGQEPRFIPNCIIYKGYVVMVAQRGIGKSWEEGGIGPGGDGDTWTVWEKYEDVMRPMFNAALVTPELKPFLQKLETMQDVFAAGMEQYLLKFGEQQGYTISNRDQEQIEKQRQHEEAVAAKQVPIPVSFGYFGLKIGERLPPETWANIKHLAEYHRGDESDMEWLDDQGHIGARASEIRGWYYQQEVITVLSSLGYTVQYSGHTVTTPEERQAIEREQRRLDNEHYVRVKEIKAKAARWRSAIIDIAREATPCSKEDAEYAAKLPEIHILDMKGADIYGGGAWLHLDGEDLFYVRNNGMDGDNWSYNNYPTGGAGAICYRIPGAAYLVAEIQSWVDSLGQYGIYAQD